MPQPQTVEYPRYISISEAIEIAKKLVSTFKGGVINIDALANALQHKNATSGTFLVKLSDLKKLGLIDGRSGTFYTTDVAKKIAIPTDENEKNMAIREMINNVKILTQLHDNLHSETAPTDNDILIQLINITKKDRAEIQPLVADISKLYKDALPYMSMTKASPQAQQQVQPEFTRMGVEISASATSSDKEILTFVANGISLKVVNDKENLEKVKKFVDLYLPDAEQKESKKEKEKKS